MCALGAAVRSVFVVLLPILAACAPSPSPSPSAQATPPAATSARTPRAPRAAMRDTTPASPAHLDDVAAATDTFDSLRQRYGDANVRRATLPGAEGMDVEGWTLFADDSKRRIDVYPDDAGTHPQLLIVRDDSGWLRSDGLHTGLDTRALETMNGRAFQFLGFDWDYGGVVDDWKGGRLAHEGRFLGPVQLCPPPDAPDDYPAGDGEFMSNLPAVRAHPAKICELGVSLAPDDSAGESTREN